MSKAAIQPNGPRPIPTDDLIFFMGLMLRKAVREPETAHQAIRHAARAFHRIVERVI